MLILGSPDENKSFSGKVPERTRKSGRRLFNPACDPISFSKVDGTSGSPQQSSEADRLRIKNLRIEISELEKICLKASDRHKKIDEDLGANHWKEQAEMHTS